MKTNIPQSDHVRIPIAISYLGIGKTKFWNLVRQGYITVIKPEGPSRKMGYVEMAQLRRYQSGQLA